MTQALAAERAKRLALLAVAVAVLVAGLAIWIRIRLTELVEEQVATGLRVTLEAAAEGVHQLLESAGRAAQAAVDDPHASAAAIGCAKANECAAVAVQLVPYMRAGGFSGVQIIDGKGRLIASEPRALRAPSAALLAETAALKPMRAVVLLPSSDTSAKLHVAAALRENTGHVGVLLFELSMSSINSVLRAARAGRSGETYAFDRRGRLLSESRFSAELQRMGIVAPGADGALDLIELRDPGRDVRLEPLRADAVRSKQPPTQMVSRALSSGAGLQLEPYRDYRGVLVVGAWTLFSDLGLGIATEVDAREVYGPLTDVERLFTWLLLALAIVTVALLAAIAYAAFLHFKLTRPRLRAVEDPAPKLRKLNS